MTPGAENAFGQDLTPNVVVVLGQDFHVDDAVINEHDVSNRNVIDETLVVDIDRMHILTAFAAHGEVEDIAWFKIELCGQVAGADGRALGVEQDTRDDTEFGGNGADILHHGAHPIVRRVAHVEAEDIGASHDQSAKPFR
jgi:hypothetical protein